MQWNICRNTQDFRNWKLSASFFLKLWCVSCGTGNPMVSCTPFVCIKKTKNYPPFYDICFLVCFDKKRHVLLCRIHNCERCVCAPFASVCICGCVCVPLDHPLCLQTGGLGGGLLANQHSSSTVISKFWCHDGVMMTIPWSQSLKCPKSDHVKFW